MFNITLHIISTIFTLQYRGEVIQWSTDSGNIYETLVKVDHKVFIFYIVEFCFLFLKLSDLVFSRLPISYQQKNCFTQSGGSVGWKRAVVQKPFLSSQRPQLPAGVDQVPGAQHRVHQCPGAECCQWQVSDPVLSVKIVVRTRGGTINISITVFSPTHTRSLVASRYWWQILTPLGALWVPWSVSH